MRIVLFLNTYIYDLFSLGLQKQIDVVTLGSLEPHQFYRIWPSVRAHLIDDQLQGVRYVSRGAQIADESYSKEFPRGRMAKDYILLKVSIKVDALNALQ